MYVKLPPRDLNLDPCPPYLTNIYTCGVNTAQRVHGGDYSDFLTIRFLRNLWFKKCVTFVELHQV